MYYSEDFVEEIREKNDIVDVISSYIKLQRKGNSYFGLCPFHNEKSPSFSVSFGKQMYHCFGCGAGGNVITFIMEYENYSFQEAIKVLADRVGIELPEQEYSKEERAHQDLRMRILEINKTAAKYFYYQLRSENGKQAMEYLKKRELTEDTMRSFGLGFANKYSNDLYQYLKKLGKSDELLRESGLMNIDETKGMYDKFWNRVIFPIMDVNNRVIGFGGRVMGDGKPKYLNSPETKVFDKSRNLYGLNIARTSRKKNMLLCEGYMDVISLHQASFKNAVASLGTALTTQHAGLLKRYTDEIILTYDNDEAGTKAALRAIPILKAAGLRSKVLHMQPYKDPDEFIKALGAEEFQKRMDQAENSFLFEISIMELEYNLKDPESKTAFFRAVAEKILEFEDELERENYMEAIAVKYQTGFENLRKLVNRVALTGIAKPKNELRKTTRKTEKESGVNEAQRLILTWLIEQKGLYAKIKDYIKPDDFTNEIYQKTASLLFQQLQDGQVVPAKIINHFAEQEQQRTAASLFNAAMEFQTKGEQEKALRETICILMKNSIAQKTANLDSTDLKGLQDIIHQKSRLEKLENLNISLD